MMDRCNSSSKLLWTVVYVAATFAHECSAWIIPQQSLLHSARKHSFRALTRYMQQQQQASSSFLSEKLDLKILLIDHYDSFTFNLADILSQICVEPPTILAADSAISWKELLQKTCDKINGDGDLLNDDANGKAVFDAIVLSPGPGNPLADGSLSIDIVQSACDLPILGVCLGHQIIGHTYGATVTLAPEPVHGQVRPIRILSHHLDDPLWLHCNETELVTRYHSLHVTDIMQESPLTVTAVSADDNHIVMAMRHKQYPHFGVQFHPESVGTACGKQLLLNFCQFCIDYHQKQKAEKNHDVAMEMVEPECRNEDTREQLNGRFRKNGNIVPINGGNELKDQSKPLNGLSVVNGCHHHPGHYTLNGGNSNQGTTQEISVYIQKLAISNICPEHVMDHFLSTEPFAFWLDESLAQKGNNAISILGASRERVEYYGNEKYDKQGVFVWSGDDLLGHHREIDILTYFENKFKRPIQTIEWVDRTGSVSKRTEEESRVLLPFDYRGGYVGYFGYEVRHDTQRFLEEQEKGHRHRRFSAETLRKTSNEKVPTAAFLFASKSFVYDHRNDEWYLVGVAREENETYGILAWLRTTAKAFQELRSMSACMYEAGKQVTDAKVPQFRANRSREKYDQNFRDCVEYIRQGESYELCLTNQLEASVSVAGQRPLDLYKILRKRNPAPFSAFFNWNAKSWTSTSKDVSSLAVCCSSPERFISIKPSKDHQSQYLTVEAKPIKGTCARVLPGQGKILSEIEQKEDIARASELQSSVKNRAENLMIVDLLRNDLSRVCEPGTVHVAKLMDIESYATVHQMVSTIRGCLDSTKRSAIDVLRATFPGGSMTGAPKLRTMELLHEIEEGVSRGPYSGCLGYISLNGCMDMNIVIRTAVLTPQDEHDQWKVSIGAGGAITALSESSDEYAEMLLKASAIVKAVQEWCLNSETYRVSDAYASRSVSSEKP